jgi:hypothetical protein
MTGDLLGRSVGEQRYGSATVGVLVVVTLAGQTKQMMPMAMLPLFAAAPS